MEKKLEAKDLITVGIFAAIYFVVFFIIGMMGYVPIIYVLLPLLLPIVCGIPYMLFLTKVKCFGMVTIMAIICGAIMLLTGHTPLPLIAGAIFGFLADLIFRAGHYQSKKLSVIGYAVFSLWIMGMLMPFWLMRDVYEKMMLDSMGVDYTSVIMNMFDTIAWVFPIMCVVGGVIGAFFGFAVLKKHFKKAGIA